MVGRPKQPRCRSFLSLPTTGGTPRALSGLCISSTLSAASSSEQPSAINLGKALTLLVYEVYARERHNNAANIPSCLTFSGGGVPQEMDWLPTSIHQSIHLSVKAHHAIPIEPNQTDCIWCLHASSHPLHWHVPSYLAHPLGMCHWRQPCCGCMLLCISQHFCPCMSWIAWP